MHSLCQGTNHVRMKFITLMAAVVAAAPRTAITQAGPMDAVHRFVNAFNKGDVPAAASTCAAETSIIDEFAPYEWHGAGACAGLADYDADAKRNGITGGVVTLGMPRHVDIAGDRAYVVVPADYAYTKKGKPVKEVASTLTIALDRSAGTWRMTGWTWGKR